MLTFVTGKEFSENTVGLASQHGHVRELVVNVVASWCGWSGEVERSLE